MSERVEIQVIARVETPYKERFGTPRQPGLVNAAMGRIVFAPEFRDPDMFRGINEFSHIWLNFLFDRVMDQGFRKLVRPPRLGGNEKVGVFATRSPYRPNHLGLSVVELDRVEWETSEGPVLHVKGIDLTDGTPLVDVRPYVVYTDSIAEAQSGFASGGRPERQVVSVAAAVRTDWDALPEGQRLLIEQTVAFDPSPQYHGISDRVYRVELAGIRVGWQREAAGILITELRSVDL